MPEIVTLKSFDKQAQTADQVVVFALDKANKRSRNFLVKLPDLADTLTKSYPNIKFLRVDNDEKGNEDDVLFEKYDLIDFPGLLYFRKGVMMSISTLILNQTTISDFLNPRIKAAPLKANSLDAISKIDSTNYTVYYASTKPEVLSLMEGLSAKFLKYTFVHVASLELISKWADANKLSILPNVQTVLIAKRQYDGHMFVLSEKEVTLETLTKFVRKSAKPYWTFFSSRTVDLIQNSDKNVALLKFDPDRDHEVIEKLKKFAPTYFEELIFVFIPSHSEQGAQMLSSFGLPEPEADLFVIRRDTDITYSKYVAAREGTLTADDVEDFVQQVLNNRVKRYLVSEAVPTKELFDGLTTVVGKTLSKEVLNDRSALHLVFYYDSNTASQIPTFQKISKQFSPEKVRFYIFNVEKNEHREVNQSHHGSIVLYSNQVKKNSFERNFSFDGHLKGADLLKFLKDSLAKNVEASSYLDTVELTEDL